MRAHHTFTVISIVTSLALGCGGGGTGGDDGGTGGGMDGSSNPNDGSTGNGDGSAGGDGSVGAMDGGPDAGSVVLLDGGGVLLPDGNVVPPGPIACQGHIYACGDAIDNDGDGLIDDRDPDCLGPCDNNEAGFSLMIPGGDSAPCKLDCYFDQDQGSGNDQCAWDHRCDPLMPDHDRRCRFQDPPPQSANCPAEQVTMCEEFCAPLVPNGCDCFGCCNLPADGLLPEDGGRWVFIGSLDDETGMPTCNVEDSNSDEACHPCTPVQNCLNTCGECELCLGRTTVPESCRPAPRPDAGTPDAGFLPDGGPRPLPDAGPQPDAGSPPPQCDNGQQPCGLPGQPDCPSGEFCLTGCCAFFG